MDRAGKVFSQLLTLSLGIYSLISCSQYVTKGKGKEALLYLVAGIVMLLIFLLELN